ncbi:unnamed protein product [Coccothraustes coccothraustes]
MDPPLPFCARRSPRAPDTGDGPARALTSRKAHAPNGSGGGGGTTSRGRGAGQPEAAEPRAGSGRRAHAATSGPQLRPPARPFVTHVTDARAALTNGSGSSLARLAPPPLGPHGQSGGQVRLRRHLLLDGRVRNPMRSLAPPPPPANGRRALRRSRAGGSQGGPGRTPPPCGLAAGAAGRPSAPGSAAPPFPRHREGLRPPPTPGSPVGRHPPHVPWLDATRGGEEPPGRCVRGLCALLRWPESPTGAGRG